MWCVTTGAALRAFIFSELAEGQPYSVDFRPEGPILVDFSARSADFFDFSTHIQWTVAGGLGSFWSDEVAKIMLQSSGKRPANSPGPS